MMNRNQWIAFSGVAVAALAVLGGVLFYAGRDKPQQQTTIEAPPPATPQAQAPAQPESAQTSESPASPKLEEQAVEQAEQPESSVAVAAPPAVEGSETPAPSAPAAQPESGPPPKEILPAFDMVRVEKTGDAVIAGRAAPGAQVAVKFNGEVVGTATANAEGAFAIVPEKPLAKGTGMLTLEMTQNGKTTQSEGSVVVAVKENAPALVAKVEPSAPTKVTQVPAPADGAPLDEVQLNVVEYDSAGNIVFSGRAKPGSTVRFYIDNVLAGEAIAGEQGEWQYKGGATVAPGEHVLRADQLNANGKVVSRIELPFFREKEEVAVAAQAQPAQTLANAEAPQKPGTKMASAAIIVPERIVIQPGHNLWRLSRQIYGKGRLYTVIYEANRDQLRNPNRIYPGQILAAPNVKAN
jgi:nucleoid-associated protein YgaU